MIPGKQYTPEILLDVLSRRKWLIVIPTVTLALATAVVTYYLPNKYQSDTLILVVPQRVPESYVRSTVTTRIETRLQSISQQILSRTRLERIIQDFNLYADRRKTDIMEDIVEAMRKDIKVDIVKGDAFRVTFTGDDPRTTMRVTERLASFFIDESLRDREVLADGTNQFLESQLEDARRRLIENEQKLADYRHKHDGELPTQAEANMQGLHNTEMQLQALNESINRDHERRLVLERFLTDAGLSATGDATSVMATAGPDPSSTVTEQLEAAQAALQAMQLRLTPNHPDVIRAKRTIVELQKRAAEEAKEGGTVTRPQTPAELSRQNRIRDVQSEVASIDRQLTSKNEQEARLRKALGEYQRRIEAAPVRDSELAELTRDYDTLQTSYKALLGKKEESQISANLERRQIGEQFRILDPARLPEKPASPNRPRLYLAGIVGALAIGLALATTREYFDRALRSEDDVRLALNLPVLATIPIIHRTKGSRKTWLKPVSLTAGVIALAAAATAAWRLLR